jgi:hypothetical protein
MLLGPGVENVREGTSLDLKKTKGSLRDSQSMGLIDTGLDPELLDGARPTAAALPPLPSLCSLLWRVLLQQLQGCGVPCDESKGNEVCGRVRLLRHVG